MWTTAEERRRNYRELIPLVFDVTGGIYYDHWGDFFHLAVFEPGEGPEHFDAALARTHDDYFEAIRGGQARRILELATGGGAFAEWMAERTDGEVLGVDLSPSQLARARRRLAERPRDNLRFLELDIMRLDELDEPAWDACVCLDAACYLPDKQAALRGIARRLAPGARFLLVDWCRADRSTWSQRELILDPFCRYWGIPSLETTTRYRRFFERAGLRLLETEDLSERVALNWERGYAAAQRALRDTSAATQLLHAVAAGLRHGSDGIELLKNQFYAAVFARIAADAGLLRYVRFLAVRT